VIPGSTRKAGPVFAGDVLDRAREIIAAYPASRSALLPLLHLLQEVAGYCTRDGMREIARLLGLTPAEVLGTASFYTMFKMEPVGRHLVSVCGTTSCLIMGADRLYANLLDYYDVADRETTSDGMFTFEEVECAAACGGAPVMQVDYLFFENVDPDTAVALLEDIRARGLDEVYAERGTATAPLPPLDADEIAAGPSPLSGPVRPDAASGSQGRPDATQGAG
jgi:NADH-quinone oxidoreductase subunit E